MSKFDARLKSQGSARTARGPIRTTGEATTFEGGGGFTRDAKSDLFLLAVSNFVSEDTFYENGASRDKRFEELVHEVTREDPEWVQSFIPWLRTEAMMRSASIVAAAEYVKAGGPNGRRVVDSAIARADEPAEMLSYWLARHGRQIPAAIKRGVADAAQRFYSEKNVLKYDGNSKGMRFVDVLQLAHVKPRDERQDALFGYLLGSRYENREQVQQTLGRLPMLSLNRRLQTLDRAEARREMLARRDTIRQAGMTWESLSGFGKMDKEAWEAVIPQMGYMALLRNLRNFDQAGVSDEMADYVIRKLTDREEVARSRQLPFRFWSAYQASKGSLRWGRAISQGLDLSCSNVPTLKGKTLILVDTSDSMTGRWGMTAHSKVSPMDAGSLFGAVLARKNADSARLVTFASYAEEIQFRKGESALTIKEKFQAGQVGHGTEIELALRMWKDEDRIVLITDGQTRGRVAHEHGNTGHVPYRVPVYGFNLGGYSVSALDTNDVQKNQYEFGGLTDRTFKMIELLEQGKSGGWPF